jgi:secondary thiamine-phosphate synthase enzyme
MKSTLHFMISEYKTLHVQTAHKQEMLDITSLVDREVNSLGLRNGFLAVYSQHTTAALFVGEFQAALIDDVQEFLRRFVEEDLPYKHNSPEFSDCDRRNAASHLRGMMLNHSVLVPVIDGKPALGQFQSVILAELDGPRDRTLRLQALGL